jgi:hypothetical protein
VSSGHHPPTSPASAVLCRRQDLGRERRGRLEVPGPEQHRVRDAHGASLPCGEGRDHHPGRGMAGDPGQVLLMRLERGDAALQRLSGDIHAVGRLRVPAHEQSPHRVRRDAEGPGQHLYQPCRGGAAGVKGAPTGGLVAFQPRSNRIPARDAITFTRRLNARRTGTVGRAATNRVRTERKGRT